MCSPGSSWFWDRRKAWDIVIWVEWWYPMISCIGWPGNRVFPSFSCVPHVPQIFAMLTLGFDTVFWRNKHVLGATSLTPGATTDAYENHMR
jgi:hypothetical protein